MLGHFVQQLTPEVIKYQVVPQCKYGSEKKKGIIDICMVLLTKGKREN